MNREKRIAVVQSNYIPWKGYFDMIAAVDEFVIYDEVQFTKNDWRNRNKIKTPQGVQWLSIPVGKEIHRRICDVTISRPWQRLHWKALEQNYRRAPCFSEIANWLAPLYLETEYTHLSESNHRIIVAVCQYLGIESRLSSSRDYTYSAKTPSERVASLCAIAGATHYVSGPAARDYLQPSDFSQRNVELIWFDYSGYPKYPQLWGDFVHEVSILDLLFNCGQDSVKFMNWAKRNRRQ